MPLQLSGEVQIADKEKLNDMLPNDFVFSFSSFRTKPTLLRDSAGIALPSGSTQSIILRDANYNIISASICRPQHLNFSDNQKNIVAELIFTFKNTRPSQERPYLFFLCFPLYKSASGSASPFLKGLLTNEPITSQMSLQDLVSDSKTFLFYNSCIPLVSKSQNVIKSYSCCALVSTHSLPVFQADITGLTLMDYMLPSSFTMDVDTIIDYKIDSTTFTFKKQSVKRGTAGKTFRATLQTNTNGFFTRFSKYTYNPVLLQKANEQSCKTSSQINTSQLKCFAIKPKSDVRNGILLVDPKTGKRMDKLLAEGEPGNINTSSGDIATSVGIVIGVLGGLIGVIILLNWLVHKYYNDGPAIVAKVVATTAATAAAAPSLATAALGAAPQIVPLVLPELAAAAAGKATP